MQPPPRGRRTAHAQDDGVWSDAGLPRPGDLAAEIGLLLAIHLALALAVAMTLATGGIV